MEEKLWQTETQYYKCRDIALPTKVHLVKAMVFPVVIYGCKSCIIKTLSAEELMLLNCRVGEDSERVPWRARRSNQSMLKEISPEYSLEGVVLKLKLQYFGHLMGKTDSLEKTLMLEKTEDRRRRGRQDEMVRWHHRLNGHESDQAPGVGDGNGGMMCCSLWGHRESDMTERLN